MKTTCNQFQKQMILIRKHLWLISFGYFLLPTYSYSQYTILTPNQNSNLILFNPAFVGNQKCPHLGINYNYQDNLKPGISNYSVEFDSYVNSLEGSAGIILNKTESESIKNLSAEFVYSYPFIITRNTKLLTAVKLNVSQSVINFTNLRDRYLYNNNFISIPQKTVANLFSVGFGALMFNRNNFIGFSLENLNKPVEAKLNEKKSRLPIKYNAIGSIAIRSRIGVFYPVITFQGQGNRFYNDTLNKFLIKDIQHLALNLNYNYNHLFTGIGYTYIFNRTPIYNVQIGYGNSKFQINYNLGYSSYQEEEINKSVNTLYHQITAEFTFPCRHKKLKFRSISCPSFGGGSYGSGHYASNSYNSSSTNSSNTNNNVTFTTTSNEQIKPGTLTAGEINDFKKWELWIDITKEDLAKFQETWKITPNKRYSVQVINESNKPATDIQVSLFSQNGEVIWKSRTDNTGKAELWVDLLGKDSEAKYIEVENNGTKYTFNEIKEFHDGVNIFKIKESCNVPNILDIAFVVDATGSMSDEINYLKEELTDIIANTKTNNPTLKINLGSLFYRCLDNSFVTRISDFSDDPAKTSEFIKKQSADEGGTEAVEVALEESVEKLSWSKNANARLLFLVLDEPPASDPKIVRKIQNAIRNASENGIRIIPLVASGTSYSVDKSLEYLMRSIALSTNGTYAFLTDHSGVGDKHSDPTIDEFNVEYMNKLILRIIHQFSNIPSCDEQNVFLNENLSDTTNVEIIEHVILDSSMVRLNKPADIALLKDTIMMSPSITIKPEETETNKDSTVTETKYITIQKSFKFYPNPTHGHVNIEIDGDIKDIYLADINGKLLEHFTFADQNQLQIDISKYLVGIYFLQYQCNNKWFSGKILLLKH